MKKNVQLHIPNPCHEDWAAMRPEERGRFCSSCCKTVVDFSLMSDREVLGYLADANGKVCGRFTSDQLQRDLMSAHERKRKGWMVWNILMMGLLFAAKARSQGKLPKPVSHQVAPGRPGKAPVTMGEPARVMTPEIMGDVTTQEDTVPHYENLQPAVVIGYRTMGRVDIRMGAISSISEDSLVKEPASPIQQLIKDSLELLGLGKKDLLLYPNPAGRGTTIRLSMDLRVSGNCMVGLYNEAGIPIQSKAMQLNGQPVVELFNLPASLPGGLYFIRLSAAGLKKEVVQKLVVL